MGVTVLPATFEVVDFDPDVIAEVGLRLCEAFGIAGDVRVEVDELALTSRVRATDGDPVVVTAESGAFEDTRRPRTLAVDAVTRTLGAALVRLLDRRGPFAEAPADEDLSLAQRSAWDVYVAGRLHRAGFAQHEQRWRYDFRNRHGFSDAADRAFDALWSAEGLRWGELASRSMALTAPTAVSRSPHRWQG